MSSYVDISTALDTYLSTMAGLPPVVQKENTVPQEFGQGLSLETFLIPGNSSQSTLYSKNLNESGIYQINVGCIKNIGRGSAIGLAEALRTHFYAGKVLTKNGTNVRITRADIGPALADSVRYRIPVSIYYRSVG